MVLLQVAVLAETQRVVWSARVLAVLARLLAAAGMVTIATHTFGVKGLVGMRAFANLLVFPNAFRDEI